MSGIGVFAMIKLKIVSLYSLTERTLIESVVYAMAEKFLEKAEIEEIREAIKMTTIGQMLREDGRAEGLGTGIIGTIKTCMDFHIPSEQILEKIMENFSLSRENAEKYMEEFNSQKAGEK